MARAAQRVYVPVPEGANRDDLQKFMEGLKAVVKVALANFRGDDTQFDVKGGYVEILVSGSMWGPVNTAHIRVIAALQAANYVTHTTQPREVAAAAPDAARSQRQTSETFTLTLTGTPHSVEQLIHYLRSLPGVRIHKPPED